MCRGSQSLTYRLSLPLGCLLSVVKALYQNITRRCLTEMSRVVLDVIREYCEAGGLFHGIHYRDHINIGAGTNDQHPHQAQQTAGKGYRLI